MADSPVILPEFLKRFRCVGAECVDTCCKGWDMQLGDKAYNLYKTEAPELLEAVSGEAGKYIMKRDPVSDYCVKFHNGWCGIQEKHGESFLGEACHFYPRMTRAVGSSAIMTAALSCPEITRLALLDDAAFTLSESSTPLLPGSLKDYLPEGLTSEQALHVHRILLETALNHTMSAEHTLMRILAACESLERINVSSWPDAVPFYLAHAESNLPAAESKPTDQVFLLQALCGLVFAAKKVGNVRLMQTIEDMEKALHVTIRKDTLAIIPLPDNSSALHSMLEKWAKSYREFYAPVLRRYLAMQLSLAFFPFGGFGGDLSERIAIIGIRLATIKLALMSACTVFKNKLPESELIRVIQSISRFMDHLAEPDLSLKIYQETGWLKKSRLRALLDDQ
jgi:lysine-N-methylase